MKSEVLMFLFNFLSIIVLTLLWSGQLGATPFCIPDDGNPPGSVLKLAQEVDDVTQTLSKKDEIKMTSKVNSSTRLYVNTSNSHYESTVISLRDAEKELMVLAQSNDLEETWVYLPENKKILEVGIRESINQTDTDYSALRKYFGEDIGTIAMLNGKVFNPIPESAIHYHIHPQINAAILDKDIPDNLIKEQRTAIKIYNHLQPSFPSAPDVSSSYQSGFISSRVVSEDGVYEIRRKGPFPRSLEGMASNANHIQKIYSENIANLVWKQVITQGKSMDEARAATILQLNGLLEGIVEISFHKP